MKYKIIIPIIAVLLISLHVYGQINFTDEIRIPNTNVQNQGRTGTCWCYATTSFIESELLRMGKKISTFQKCLR